ncbi:unnamed protein product [Brassica napus]|uniref:(rape) hypothetical protein n=1 Tax=Brassica napus TaxID=3708 RepID=A0A817ARJ7_BRANA|nr:unnamed protein product [Brassica napus]
MASTALDVSRAELALVVMYLNKAEARDKLCRAIQYGSKFLSGGQPGTAQTVDKSTSLARKVFRLFKFVNDLHGLISPVPKGTPLPLVLLGKSKNALLSTFLFLDQIVWLGRSGIYKNKERAELLGRISLFCWMGSSVCTTLVELGEIGRLSSSMKKIEKGLKNGNKYQDEEYRAKLKKSNERSLALIKSAMDIVVAAGLLQLSPNKITPRVTGAFGFITSIISCYQVLKKPKFCRHDQDPDMAWYTKMDSCLTPLPEVDEAEDLKTVAGGKVEKWPTRLNAVPPRINTGDLKEITPEGFLGDTKLWKQRVSYYKTLDYQLGETGRYRNILDMNAYVGGFAAALADEPVWVMNVVPVEAKLNTLGVIYERGLIGTYQNCEGSSEDESDGLEIESGTSLAKHLESTNAIFSFVWWIIGFYWISAGSEELAQSSPQLYWLCVAFLAFDVIFLVLCVAVASLIAIAVCCCLPCIIAVLYALAEQEGASDEEIERLPRFKFLTVRNSEKVNGEILETHGGIMTQLGVDSPSERVLSSDEAECCVCLCEYEDGTELRELWCRHHFHEACIDKWLRINATCPLCKSNILKTDEQSGNDAV